MKSLSANAIRQKFLEFFESKQHKIVESDSVVPKDDPTVLFTTAGMQQFKRQFLGNTDDFTRATTSQKCIRTDDLDEVGQTNFHHTFFEMLGNFSFGDYFKKEAITWAWEFFTGVLDIPQDRLWVSVYYDDQEAYDIWKNEIGIPEHKIFKLGDKSNFWPSNAKQSGPNGPCGPCSEIFFDYDPNDPTVPKDPDDIDGRFAEVWNLVFTQFNRKEGGELEPLPSKNIDTGMGLERLCAVIQGKESNFETDLFEPIIQVIDDEITANLSITEKRIIADHIRAATFAISDGIIPSNKERGSVVKSLINRSVNLVLKNGGKEEPCVYKLVAVIADVMKDQYPEVAQKTDNIAGLIQKVEEAFITTWKTKIPELKQKLAVAKSNQEHGELYFEYWATHGLPFDTIINLLPFENPKDFQEAFNRYHELKDEHRDKSREGSKMTGDVFTDIDLDLDVPKTKFLGYDLMTAEAKVLRIFHAQESVETASAGENVRIVLDQTPFYAESGGQIGDKGMFTTTANGVMTVSDTQKLDDIFLHTATVKEGQISVGDTLTASVDTARRLSIMRNHTATHLLQAALRKVLGEHVQQQGSVVDENRLRFDFTHPKALTDEEKAKVEQEVDKMVRSDTKVEKSEMTIDEARQKGALAFFAEKYGQTVRVVQAQGFSTELCGGTHLDNTGEVGMFKIISESAIAQGIRRIEATTADLAKAVIEQKKQRELEEQELRKKKEQRKELKQETFHRLKAHMDEIVSRAETVNSSKVVSHIFQGIDIAIMRNLSDIAKQKAKTAAVIFGTATDDNASMIVALTDDLISKGIKAGDIIKESAPVMDGRGGGKPQFAQAGGKNVEKLGDAVKKAQEVVIQKLSYLRT